jgi:hypothetical protein
MSYNSRTYKQTTRTTIRRARFGKPIKVALWNTCWVPALKVPKPGRNCVLTASSFAPLSTRNSGTLQCGALIPQETPVPSVYTPPSRHRGHHSPLWNIWARDTLLLVVEIAIAGWLYFVRASDSWQKTRSQWISFVAENDDEKATSDIRHL